MLRQEVEAVLRQMDVIAALTCTMSRPFGGILLTRLRWLWGHRILRPTKSDYPPSPRRHFVPSPMQFPQGVPELRAAAAPAEGTSIRSTVSQHLPSEIFIWVNSPALKMQRTGKRLPCCFSDKMERPYPADWRCRKTRHQVEEMSMSCTAEREPEGE